jgi:cell division protein FtsN
MTRDYKKTAKRSPQRSPSRGHAKRQPKKKPNQSPPGWLWLFAGVLLGILIMSLTKLSEIPSDQDTEIADDSSTDSVDDNGKKPRFDFYTLLRESEVIVPDTPDTNPSTQSANSNDVFLLQVGSFKSNRDADSLRARLLLLNLDAKIEKVSPRKNETWHRVIVGPFIDRSELADARGKLASNGIDSLLLKRKK